MLVVERAEQVGERFDVPAPERDTIARNSRCGVTVRRRWA